MRSRRRRGERQRFTVGATSAEERAFSSVRLDDLTAAGDLPAAFPKTLPEPATIVDDYQQQARALDRAIDKVDGAIAAASSERANAAQRDVWIYGGGAVFAMLLTLALIWFVARAVVRPVRRLTAAAREMSQTQLPQLVELLRKAATSAASSRRRSRSRRRTRSASSHRRSTTSKP